MPKYFSDRIAVLYGQENVAAIEDAYNLYYQDRFGDLSQRQLDKRINEMAAELGLRPLVAPQTRKPKAPAVPLTTYKLTAKTRSTKTAGHDYTYTDANGAGIKIINTAKAWTYQLALVGECDAKQARKIFKAFDKHLQAHIGKEWVEAEVLEA